MGSRAKRALFGRLWRTVGLIGRMGGTEGRMALQLPVDTQDDRIRAQVHVESGETKQQTPIIYHI